MTMRIRFLILMAASVPLLGIPSRAIGQSGVQITRDGKAALVSKDVGDQRWAITYNFSDHTATGNVFTAGQKPAFVWCQQTGNDGQSVNFTCYGAESCPAAPCSPSQWSFISNVDLPLSFLYPPGGVPAGPTPRQTPRSKPTPTPPSSGCPINGPITNLQRDCSAYAYEYQQGAVLFALSSNGEIVATCFANDPAKILCVGGPVTGPTTAALIGINLNSGPILPLDSNGTLSISGSSLRISFAFQGTRLDANPTWVSTERVTAADNETSAHGALSEMLAKAARDFVNAPASLQGSKDDVLDVLRSLGAAPGN
jgi:hypothetical protein